jgi:hypothetical protein
VERTDAEGRPAAGAITMLIDPLGGLLHAKGTRSALPIRIVPKDQPDELRLDRIGFEAFLDLGASAFGRNDAIASGGVATCIRRKCRSSAASSPARDHRRSAG